MPLNKESTVSELCHESGAPGYSAQMPGPLQPLFEVVGPLGEHQKLLTVLALGEEETEREEHGTVSQAAKTLFCTHNVCDLGLVIYCL